MSASTHSQHSWTEYHSWTETAVGRAGDSQILLFPQESLNPHLKREFSCETGRVYYIVIILIIITTSVIIIIIIVIIAVAVAAACSLRDLLIRDLRSRF